jgi:NAD(P)-dependent dehydrogenase (short-subunit alcohol dehydrogenase family)
MSYNPFTLENKSILVTGASSGIGKSIAVETSKMGARLVLVDRDQEGLNNVLLEVSGDGHAVFCCDLRLENEIITLTEKSIAIDGLVHCAGIGLTLPFKFTSSEELNRVMVINFRAPVLLTQQLLKKKKINKNGSIVYLSSIDGVVTGHVGNSIYAASKGAIVGMAKTQAIELAMQKIRVNCILPGRVETPLIKRENISEEQVQKNKELYPFKRYAKPEEIAYYAIYLLSDASTYTTGSNLIIDGGFTLL